MRPGQPLPQLIAQAQQRDPVACGELIRRFQQSAYAFCCGVLGDLHLAEDATQDAFLEACQKLPDLECPQAFASWLRRILLKQCDRVRRSRRAVEPLADIFPGDAAPPQEAAESRETRDRMLQSLRSLPKHERIVTTLFYMDGYSQERIAEFLEVPIGTIKSRLNAARRRLRESVMQEVDEALKSNPLPQRFAEVIVEMRFAVDRVIPLAARMRSLTDVQLAQNMSQTRDRFAAGDHAVALAQVLAATREATRRQIGLEHYAVQIVAAQLLERGWIAEAPCGEGKTLSSISAVAAWAAQGRRVCVITPNDYLARRDGEFARPVLERIGIRVGWVDEALTVEKRQEAYACDVVYGTAVELAADHLRGLLTPFGAAIIDEADSLLLDDAAVEVVVGTRSTPWFGPIDTTHGLSRGRDYIVENGRVLPIDVMLGRVLVGRVWRDGVLQSVEISEGLAPTPAIVPQAAVTLGGFLRSFGHLAGLTGTAVHRADLFKAWYGLESVALPTHRDSRRVEHPDRVYSGDAERCAAAVEEALHYARNLGRPVLLAAPDEQTCLRVGQMLQGIGMLCLATREHEAEITKIIGRASQPPEPAAITIVSPMAGRGADIALSGPDRGGLHVIGIGRHRSRRVDLQFCRRAARQGQLGSSRFHLAIDDEVLRSVRHTVRIGQGGYAESEALHEAIARSQIASEDQLLQSRQPMVVLRSPSAGNVAGR